jgi:hypothetical protein
MQVEAFEEKEIPFVEFRLTYDGPLPCESKRNLPLVKHRIREQLHPQLKDLCTRVEPLDRLVQRIQGRGKPSHSELHEGLNLPRVGMDCKFGAFHFVPLIVGRLHMVCALDILFLRREQNTSLIRKPKDEYGGDLDNRLKVFLDALRTPRHIDEIPRDITPIATPFLCLLEDDSLITKFQVEADSLLGGDNSEKQKDVRLIVRVTTKLTRSTLGNIDFAWLG